MKYQTRLNDDRLILFDWILSIVDNNHSFVIIIIN